MLWLAGDDWIIEHLLYVEAVPVVAALGISKQVVALFFVTALLLLTFIPMGRALSASPVVPRGPLVNLLEVILLFLRDEVTRPFLGKAGDKYLPVLWTIFFYILYCNLIGLLPIPLPLPLETHHGVETHWFGTTGPTGYIQVTGTLALMAGLWWHGLGIREQGLVNYVKNFVPGGLPAALVPMLFLIELVSHVIKILALAIRLWANMMGGHTVLYVVLGLTFIFGPMVGSAWPAIGIMSSLIAVPVYFLEIFVAFLQAYVFTFLVTVFLGMALHPDH